MTDKTSIQPQAKAELLNHLEKLHCTVTDERQIPEGEFLSLKSGNGIRHDVFIQLLNLDEVRNIKIPQSVFDYEIQKGQWILLVLYMTDMQLSLPLTKKIKQTSGNTVANKGLAKAGLMSSMKHFAKFEFGCFN